MPAVIHGMDELSRAFAAAGSDAKRHLRSALREAAEPVRHDAEELAVSRIRRMSRSPKWAGMRVGVLTRVVYVAPKSRGITTRGPDPRRRPNLAELLLERAMEPALEQNEGHVVVAVQDALDRTADDFNRKGI